MPAFPLPFGASAQVPVPLTTLIDRDQELAAVVVLPRDPNGWPSAASSWGSTGGGRAA